MCPNDSSPLNGSPKNSHQPWAIRWAFCAAAHLYELPPITDSPRVEVSSDCWRPTDYRHRVLCIGVERGGAP